MDFSGYPAVCLGEFCSCFGDDCQPFCSRRFLPKVFLPQAVQRVSSCMPTAVLMDAFRSMVTESMGKNEILRLMVLFTAGFLVSWFKEVQED